MPQLKPDYTPDPERLVRVGDIVSPREIADMFGLTRAAVCNWARRHPDFPLPVAYAAGPLYLLPEVMAFVVASNLGIQRTVNCRQYKCDSPK